MLNYEQQIDLGKNLGIWSVNSDKLKCKDLSKEQFQGAYIYEPTRGGMQIIVGSDGKFLSFASSLSLKKVLEDIKNSNLWSSAQNPSNKSYYKCSCGQINEIDLTKAPLGIKVDYRCTKCGSFHLKRIPISEQTIQKINLYFAIENKDNPSLETIAKDIATEAFGIVHGTETERLEKLYSISTKPVREINDYLTSIGAILPKDAQPKEAALAIFKQKASKIQERPAQNNKYDLRTCAEKVVDSYFTIENKKDPFWEDKAKEIAKKYCESLKRGSSHFVMSNLSGLSGLTDEQLEEKLVLSGVKLPTSSATKNSILKVFRSKLNKITEKLKQMSQTGIKW